MWEIPERPRSGVKNCHAVGVYSFVFNDDLRMFACLNWTSLAANDYGDVVGFHNHHRDLTLKVAFGEVENIELVWDAGDNGTRPYGLWMWDSRLRGGKGRFKLIKKDSYINTRTIRAMTQKTRALHLPWSRLHTVKQTTKHVGWFVREGNVGTTGETFNFSRNDLSDWHKQDSLYVEMDDDELRQVWNEVRGYAINARKRNV